MRRNLSEISVSILARDASIAKCSTFWKTMVDDTFAE